MPKKQLRKNAIVRYKGDKTVKISITFITVYNIYNFLNCNNLNLCIPIYKIYKSWQYNESFKEYLVVRPHLHLTLRSQRHKPRVMVTNAPQTQTRFV